MLNKFKRFQENRIQPAETVPVKATSAKRRIVQQFKKPFPALLAVGSTILIAAPSFAATGLRDIQRCGVSTWSFYGALRDIFGWFGQAQKAWPALIMMWEGWPIYAVIAAIIGVGWLAYLIVRALNAWLAARRACQI